MSSAKVPPSDFKGTVKVGITTGLVAGVALFAVFLSIDQQLGLTNGLFFKIAFCFSIEIINISIYNFQATSLLWLIAQRHTQFLIIFFRKNVCLQTLNL